jgi:hypothetical protein
MDVWDYFRQKDREFKNASAYPDSDPFQEEDGSDGKIGRVKTILDLTDDAYIKVTERVVIRDGVAERVSYAYGLVIDGAFFHGWERAPNHPDCPVHEHGSGPTRDRYESEPVTLPEVLERAWDELSLRAEAPP